MASYDRSSTIDESHGSSAKPAVIDTEPNSPQPSLAGVNNAHSSEVPIQPGQKNGNSWAKFKAIGIKWHLPLLLLLAVVLGATWPSPAQAANDTPLSTACVILIFFISGLKLKTSEFFDALSNYKAWVFGLVSIFGITPAVAMGLVRIPFKEEAFSLGLAIFFVMPSTISSCIVLTGQAKGNVALSLFLSVSSNLLSIVLAPLWLTAVLRGVSSVTLDILDLFVKLITTILVPLVVGKGLQYIPWVKEQVSKSSTTLKLMSSVFLCLIPWMKVSEASDALRKTNAGVIFALLGIGIAVHIMFLLINAAAVVALRLQYPEQAAVVLSASQKTLSVAVAVIDAAPAALGNAGLLLVPCILSHMSQIIVDAVLIVAARSRIAAAVNAASGSGPSNDVELAQALVPAAEEQTESENTGVESAHVAVISADGLASPSSVEMAAAEADSSS